MKLKAVSHLRTCSWNIGRSILQHCRGPDPNASLGCSKISWKRFSHLPRSQCAPCFFCSLVDTPAVFFLVAKLKECSPTRHQEYDTFPKMMRYVCAYHENTFVHKTFFGQLTLCFDFWISRRWIRAAIMARRTWKKVDYGKRPTEMAGTKTVLTNCAKSTELLSASARMCSTTCPRQWIRSIYCRG